MTMRGWPLLLPLLALAACEERSTGDELIAPDPELVEEQTLPSPAPEPATGPGYEAQAVANGEFPRAFRGSWTLAAGECEPGAADATGLMQVAADHVDFYESRAEPAAMERTGPNVLRTTLSFSGEGESWTRETVFRLEDMGTTLIRHEADMEPLAYRRCGDMPAPE